MRFASMPVLAVGLLLSACGGGGGAAINVSPNSLSFTAGSAGFAPNPQQVTAKFRGAGILVGFPVDEPSVDWIAIETISETLSRGTYNIHIASTDLSPGTYGTTLRFVTGTESGDIDFEDVDVTFTVTGQALEVTTDPDPTRDFIAAANGALPAPQAFTIEYNGDDLILPTVPAWLDLVETASSPGSKDFSISVNSSAFAAGTNLSDALTFRTTRAGGQYFRETAISVGYQVVQPLEITSATITVNVGAPKLTVSPAGASFAVDGATTPAEAVAELTVSDEAGGDGSQAVTWSVGAISVPWLSVTPTTGDSGSPETLEVHLVPAEMTDVANGNHSATITLNYTNADGNGALEVPVNLALTLPRVRYVAPYVALAGTEGTVALRGEYLDAVPEDGLTLDGQALDFTPMSPTELRATHAALAAGNYPIEVGNALGIPPGDTELVVVPTTNFAASTIDSPHRKKRIVNDAERGIVYAVDEEDRDLERYRLVGGAWVGERINTAPALVNDIALSPDGKTLVLLADAAIYEADAAEFPLTFTAKAFPGTLQPDEFHNYGYDFTAGTLVPLNDGRFTVTGSGWAVFYDLATHGITNIVGDTASFTSGAYGFGSAGGNLAMIKDGNGSPGFFNASTGEWNFASVQYFGQHFAMSRFAERMAYGCTAVLNADASQLLGKVEGRQFSCVLSHDGVRAFTWYRATETGPGEVRAYDLAGTPDLNGYFPILATIPLTGDPGAYYANDLTMTLSKDENSLLIFGNAKFVVLPLP